MRVRRSGPASNTRTASTVSSEGEEDIDILENEEECNDDHCTHSESMQLGRGLLLSALDPEFSSSASTSSLKPTIRRHESIPQWGSWLPRCLWNFRRSMVGHCWFNGGWSLCRRRGNDRRSLKHCILLGFGILMLSLCAMIPIAYRIVEKRFPHVPLQLWVHVYPPTLASTNDDENDKLHVGKSCRYDRRRRWICRSCPDAYNSSTVPSSTSRLHQQSCHTLRPRGKCPAFRRFDWSTATRSVSHYDPQNDIELDYRTLSFAGRFFYHMQPQCTLTNSICFNLDRCQQQRPDINTSFDGYDTTGRRPPLAVYVNMTRPRNSTTPWIAMDVMDFAIQQSIIRVVSDYRDACLILAFADTYETITDLHTSESWNNVPTSQNDPLDRGSLGSGGRNHLIYNMSRFRFHQAKRLSSDAPLTLYHVGLAAVASDAWTSSLFRPGFDQALPLPRHWHRKENHAAHLATSSRADSVATLDIHRPRKWLLTFRGNIRDGPQPYYQHRWLAAEYWNADNKEDDIFVDVRCEHSVLFGSILHTIKDYEYPGSIYDELMWESTFGFAPGGSGVGSYRFGEILSTGGIPVVTHDLVLPLAPEMDWSDCVVRVSEARIIDLPRRLRSMPAAEVRNRQRRCWHLFQSVLGDKRLEEGKWTSDERVTFARSMEIWSVRVSHALALRDTLRTVNSRN
jgi:Exostosin family